MITDIRKIEVLYRDRTAGILQMDPASGVCVFEYDKRWLADGFALSPTELPLRGGLFFGDKELFNGNFATFENSLPDGYGRSGRNRSAGDRCGGGRCGNADCRTHGGTDRRTDCGAHCRTDCGAHCRTDRGADAGAHTHGSPD